MKKRLFTALACVMLATALPMSAHAEEGEAIHGYSSQEQATELAYNTHYYEEGIKDDDEYYYKFKTGNNDGVYLLSFQTKIDCGDTKTDATLSVKILNTFGTTKAEANAGGNAAAYRDEGSKRIIDVVMPLNGLNKGEYYYIAATANDGAPSKRLDMTNKMTVKFVPFVPAGGFSMKNNDDGSMTFGWSNIQTANTYNSLRAYDGFQLELKAGDKVRTKYIGNGEATSFTLKPTDPDLIALGYPAKEISIRLGSLQKYKSVLENRVTVTNCVYSTVEFKTKVIAKKSQAKSNGFKYKITKVKGDGSGTVSVMGCANRNACPKKVKIPDTVTINGTSFKVTAIEKNAFKDINWMTSLEVGVNVNKIDQGAFVNCKSLKTITFKTKKLKTVGKEAFKNINAKATVYCPSNKTKKSYKKLLKKKITTGVKYKV